MAPRNWMDNLATLCLKFNVEAKVSEKTDNFGIKTMSFKAPRELAGEEKAALIRTMPVDIKSEFSVGPKEATIGILSTVFSHFGIKIDKIDYDTETRELEFNVHPVHVKITQDDEEHEYDAQLLPEDHPIWENISWAFKHDGAIDTFKLVCEKLDFLLIKDIKNAKIPDDIQAALNRMEEFFEREQEGDDMRPEPVSKPNEVKLEEPKRITKINDDDLVNLKIALETCNDVDSFINSL